MKTILCSLFFALMAGAVLGDTGPLSSAVQKGLFEEEVNRNFPAAIAAYESAVAKFDQDRQLAATAIFRLAENYRRAERTEEAEALYKRVVREFHDQTELARLAAEYLPEGRLDTTGPTLLDEENQEIERLKKLVRDSPDLLFAQSDGGNSRLHEAIKQRQLKVAEFLISQGLDLTTRNNEGETPLHLAVRNGFRPGVELLLNNGADVMSQVRSGSTPLHLAANGGFLAIVELLLEHSADVNGHPMQEGNTPLHLATARGHMQVFQLLLGRGANVNAPNADGATALHFAISKRMEFAQLLLDRGADPNILRRDGVRREGGITPLHDAVRSLNTPFAELLIEHGADVNKLDGRGRSPWDYLPTEFPDSDASTVREMAALLRQHEAMEGKYHAVITDPDDREQVILWDRSERMTIKKALTKVGITLEDLERVGKSRPETQAPGKPRGRIQDLASEEERMRNLADEIRRRREDRRNHVILSADDVAAILTGESEDVELENGSMVFIRTTR